MLTVLSQSQDSEDLNTISQYLNLNFEVSVPVSACASIVTSTAEDQWRKNPTTPELTVGKMTFIFGKRKQLKLGQREESKSGFPYLLNTYEEINKNLTVTIKISIHLNKWLGRWKNILYLEEEQEVHVPEKGVGWCEVNEEKRFIPPKGRLTKAHRAERCSIHMKAKRPHPIFRTK